MASEVQAASRPELEARRKQAVEREPTREGWYFRPDVDILEKSDEFLVTADLPGVDQSKVNVRLDQGVLTIDADLALEPDPSWAPVHTEYRLGGYRREFALSESIDPDRIHASMRNGVLELHLPKVAEERPRTIQVQAG